MHNDLMRTNLLQANQLIVGCPIISVYFSAAKKASLFNWQQSSCTSPCHKLKIICSLAGAGNENFKKYSSLTEWCYHRAMFYCHCSLGLTILLNFHRQFTATVKVPLVTSPVQITTRFFVTIPSYTSPLQYLSNISQIYSFSLAFSLIRNTAQAAATNRAQQLSAFT